MKKFFKEFKEFISKGNVFDMAVGLIIATAFNKIVSSLVNDIIMPLITWATGANSIADLSITLKESIGDNGEVVKLTWKYGMFLQTVIDFLIIAFSVFIMVKIVNSSRKRLLELGDLVVEQSKKEARLERKELRKIARETNRPFAEVYKERQLQKEAEAKQLKEKAEEEKKQKEEQDRLNNPTELDLLKDIRELLKDKNN